jgi:acetylornithine/N-succinyldiaminopimelate aminotransferase
MKTTAAPAVPERIQDLEAAHIVPTYARAPVAFVRGEGVWLVDAGGRRYLDLLSGIGVASLGHGHPGLAAALAEQARTLAHTSNLYYHPLQGEAAARLAGLSGLPRVFFTNSGTEAVEACLKFARRYWTGQGCPDRTGFVALRHGFAGRTLGSLSVTWDDHYRAPFQPLVPGVTFVDPADPAALEAAVTRTTAAIIAEPIQGEGGVRPLPPATAAAIARACDATGTLLIADEVQCGLGRTGAPFAFPSFGLRPDLVSVGKAIGGGMPVGAALVSERVAAAIRPGDHGSTYGGNLLACRAALFVLEQLVEGGLLDHVGRVGSHLASRLRELAARHAAVREVRGRGLMWGLELDRDAAPVVAAALERGLVVNRTAGCVIRLLPPYVITEDEIDEGLVRLDAALEAARGGDA